MREGNISEAGRLGGKTKPPDTSILLTVSPFCRDGPFSLGSLHRLEAAGVPVVTSLRELFEKNPAPFNEVLRNYIVLDKVKMAHWDEWFRQWEMGPQNSRQITWSSLLELLRELNLDELSQEIEIYFSTLKSLREMCRSVILSALLEQKSLDPDQLPTRLPDYVPPTLKQSLQKCL